VIAIFRQPFDILVKSIAIAAGRTAANDSDSAKHEIWLPFLNTYRTVCMAPSLSS
jgi:hypothetical protein